MAVNKIHWLASWPKSGNTWVRMMLAAYHQGIASINAPVEITALDIQRYAHFAVSPRPLDQLEPSEALMLRHAALMHLTVRHPVFPTVLKTHHANAKVDGIDLIPWAITGSAIYIVRDPRDIVISYAEHMGTPIDSAIHVLGNSGASLDDPPMPLKHFLTTWSNHVKTWRDEAEFPVLMLRYEDMLEDPKESLRSIVSHLGMEPNEDKLDAGVNQADFSNLRKQEESEGFAETSPQTDYFFKRGTSGNWQGVLTRAQVMRVEELCGEVMEELSYELEEV